MVYIRKNCSERTAKIIHISKHLLALCLSVFSASASLAQVEVLVDHVGYETLAPKQAVIKGTAADHPQQFTLIDADTGKSVFQGALQLSGPVDAWGKWFFWTADFSKWQKPGHYTIETSTDSGVVRSCSFA
ncbi:MAG TPA: cellulase N-terminal Ig-like domain-containing protein, partial [Alloacidobacterium sp.]|nr:cellulase N-terminal Ig-like domain-containing protein [Alloacidobacterium sp.]